MLNTEQLLKMLVRLIVLFTVLPVHEFAHAYVADKLGDPTPRYNGRLTLNPFKHLDFFGSILIMLVGFGYAKPVPVSTRYLKNPKRDFALIAFAGPISNIIMAFVCMTICKLIILIFAEKIFTSIIIFSAFQIFEIATQINITLAVFNLLPIPPLDGSRLVTAFLPDKAYNFFLRYEKYIMFLLFALIFLNILDRPLYYLSNKVFDFIYTITSFIPI